MIGEFIKKLFLNSGKDSSSSRDKPNWLPWHEPQENIFPSYVKAKLWAVPDDISIILLVYSPKSTLFNLYVFNNFFFFLFIFAKF